MRHSNTCLEHPSGEGASVQAFAPGRVNLIGEHTDYNDGLCLPFAVKRGVTVTAKPASGGAIEAHARDLGESDSFQLGVESRAAEGWRLLGARRRRRAARGGHRAAALPSHDRGRPAARGRTVLFRRVDGGALPRALRGRRHARTRPNPPRAPLLARGERLERRRRPACSTSSPACAASGATWCESTCAARTSRLCRSSSRATCWPCSTRARPTTRLRLGL